MTPGINWDQARARIDAGRTGEKVAAADPALAPLGTDEEAGGAATPPATIEADTTGGEAERSAGRRRVPRHTLLLIGVVAAAGVALLLTLGVS